MPAKIARENILADIERVNDSTDGILHYRDYADEGAYHPSTVVRKFGGFNAAKEKVGAETAHVGRPGKGIRPFIRRVKRWEKCERCGENRNATLQFHHLDPSEKVAAISQMYYEPGYTIEDVKDEIKKCEVLCANCHAVEHETDNPYSL